MSAGICGKRLGFEDIFGSPSSPSPKRSRRSRYESPTAVDLTFGSDDKLQLLLRMFSSMDREVVESVFNSHHQNIDETIKSLHTLCIGDNSVSDESVGLNQFPLPSDPVVEDGMNYGMNYNSSEKKPEETQDNNVDAEHKMPQDGSSWVNLFVQEMTNASNWDDVRGRTRKFLEAFERNIVEQKTASGEQEIALLKEQAQYLLRDNQILKKAFAILRGRNMEHEEKLKEVEQLKHVISQYQEQVRSLELNNYTLKIHLQRSQGSNSMPSHFHPDIF